MKFFIIASISCLGLMGCQGYKTLPVEMQNESNTSSLTAPRLSKSHDAQISWTSQPNSALNGELNFDYDLKVSYGRVYSVAAEVLKMARPYACQPFTQVELDSPASYHTQEIPCGKIVDGNWKLLKNYTVDPIWGEASGFQYYSSGATLPILMGRSSAQGSYSEQDLTTKSLQNKTSSLVFGEDVSVKYEPHGNSARMSLCVNVPGTTLTSPPQFVYGKAWKKVLGQKISYDTQVLVQPGLASFEYGRACFAADFQWSAQDFVPQVRLSTIEKPVLKNVTYQGLHFQIQDWFLRALDNLISQFTVSIRKSIAANLTMNINEIADAQVESGQWFTMIHGENFVQNFGQQATQKMQSIFNQVGLPKDEHDLRALLQNQCRVIKFARSEKWTQKIRSLCEQHLAQVQFQVTAFEVDPDSAARGCSDGFASINQAKTKPWWSEQCYFRAKFKMKIPVQLQSLQTEIQNLLSEAAIEAGVPTGWLTSLPQALQNPVQFKAFLAYLETQGLQSLPLQDIAAWAQKYLSTL